MVKVPIVRYSYTAYEDTIVSEPILKKLEEEYTKMKTILDRLSIKWEDDS